MREGAGSKDEQTQEFAVVPKKVERPDSVIALRHVRFNTMQGKGARTGNPSRPL